MRDRMIDFILSQKKNKKNSIDLCHVSELMMVIVSVSVSEKDSSRPFRRYIILLYTLKNP